MKEIVLSDIFKVESPVELENKDMLFRIRRLEEIQYATHKYVEEIRKDLLNLQSLIGVNNLKLKE